MNIVRLNLPKQIDKQIAQGVNAVTMSRKVTLPNKEMVDALDAANTNLAALAATAMNARRASTQATAAMLEAAALQRTAYGNLGAQVNTAADGSDAFVYSAGFEVRAIPTPVPPITEAPTDVRTSINGVPGRVTVAWKGLFGARVYEVQYTTDLTGESDWKSAPTTPSKGRLEVNGLTSGTRYAFRVRALANGEPGPWSGPVQQMAT